MATTILLADDRAIVRAGIRNALIGLPDIEIIGEVGSGPALFESLCETPPDCLLMDVTMPDFDPFSAIKQIRARLLQMIILVVSAFDDEIYVQGLMRLGVSGYHLKDQLLSDLRLAVQGVIAGERWVSSRLLDRLAVENATDDGETPKLTLRQREMLQLLHNGMDNRNIAQQLALSIKTVENHLTSLYKIISVRSRLEAVNYIMQHPELLAANPAMPAPPAARVVSRSKQTILIVDNNERYRHQLTRTITLINPHTQVYEAATIQEAVYFAQQMRPRLALVDMVLGDENGIQCIQRIAKLSPGSRIVLFSAYPDSEFHRRGLKAGAVAFWTRKTSTAPRSGRFSMTLTCSNRSVHLPAYLKG
jgi:DNA-binding NarL/FixJ family response regulator